MAIGRVFRIKERASFYVRAEFQNVFNRLFYQMPSNQTSTTITTPTGRGNSLSGVSGLLSSGWGYVNWVNGGSPGMGGAQPRSGQIVARFTF
jgi:hypothetical protein